MSNVLKPCRNKAATVSGTAEMKFKASGEYRLLKSGRAWFANPHVDDYFYASIHLANDIEVVKLYDDDVAGFQSKGLWCTQGFVEMTNLLDIQDIPKDFYIKITGVKGDGSADTLYGNVFWGY
ncbi:MAG: hypothetical protein ACE5DQ_01695 [Candidatus Paceibacterota bacterium]